MAAGGAWEDGQVLRWITAGESHGRALVAVVEGMVAGVHVTSADIADQLARRRLGYGRGARMTFERDAVTVLSGIRHGSTLGGPIAIEIGNTEWPKWETVMAADPVDPAELADVARNASAHPGRGRDTATTRACLNTASTTRGRCWSGPAPARPPPGSRRARSHGHS
ncbi:Chorismate synthase [Mycobacterium tuberculosis variant bovis BCG str. ATCC 35743]|nr:Chorismate synthase [Mycobacterium tuberculosis variant bovis BCG str. ATCC 35743]